MKGEGVVRLTSKDFASKEILNARHIFRFGALAVPLSMATYGLLVYFGAIGRTLII